MRSWLSWVGVEPGRRTLRLIAALGLLGPAPAAFAEDAQRVVVVQRDGADVPRALREDVDKRVIEALDGRPHVGSAYASRVPLEDIELAAGCSARDVDCTHRIAASLDADWLLVRELGRDRAGHAYLTLIAYDGRGALISRRVVSAIGDAQHPVTRVVPSLIDSLYPETRAMPLREPAKEASPAGKVVGWSTAGAGASLLVVGSVMAALSKHDHAAYQRAVLRTRGDVDYADGMLSRSRDRARISNGLLLGGAAAGLAGAATLLWTYLHGSRSDEQAKGTQIAIAPASAGFGMSLAGAWRGGL